MCISICFFFFNDTATTEIYTLSLHDALPISQAPGRPRRPDHLEVRGCCDRCAARTRRRGGPGARFSPAPSEDRKSTRLNSSHANISYAVFCLKKKKSIL